MHARTALIAALGLAASGQAAVPNDSSVAVPVATVGTNGTSAVLPVATATTLRTSVIVPGATATNGTSTAAPTATATKGPKGPKGGRPLPPGFPRSQCHVDVKVKYDKRKGDARTTRVKVQNSKFDTIVTMTVEGSRGAVSGPGMSNVLRVAYYKGPASLGRLGFPSYKQPAVAFTYGRQQWDSTMPQCKAGWKGLNMFNQDEATQRLTCSFTC